MADLTPYYNALQKADAAGDTAGAKQLADFIRSQAAAPAVHSYDLVNGEMVPTGSQAALAARSPVAHADPNAASPVSSEIGAGLENLRAGAGKYFADLGRGIGQKLGMVSYQDVADSRAQDAPLMGTTMGKVGNIGAGIVTTLPALAIPGANTVAGAGAIGAVTGALQPAASAREAIINPIVGGAVGAGAQYVGQKIGQYASGRLAARAADAAEQTSTNAERDAVLQEGRKAGYVVPPTEVNPSATATALESVSGKAATKQAAQAVNQKVTNQLVAKDLGLPPTQPITQDALAQVRQEAGKVYQQVKQVGNIATDSQYLNDLTKITNASDEVAKAFPGATTPAAEKIDNLVNSLSQDQFSAAQALEYTKRLRQQASANFTLAARSADPEARALAQAQSQGADALEEMIGRHLDKAGNSQLLQDFQEARTTIAKSYQAQAALKGGNVNAQRLAQQLQKGKPMSDGFGTIARFADHFPQATKLPQGGVGVSKLAATVGGSGVMAGALTGNVPLAAASLAGTAAPYAVRQGLLSQVGQAALATPSYAPGALGTIALKGLQQAPNVALPLGLQAPRLTQGQ
jgi:hypothetical protein